MTASSQPFVESLPDQHASDSEIGNWQSVIRSETSPPEKAVRCCDPGWPSFWVVVLSCAISGIVANLMTPDLATIYFNGGTFPCTGAYPPSPACIAAVQKSNKALAAFNTISGILVFVSAPVIGMVADARGVRTMLMLSLVLGTLGSFVFISVVIFGVPIYATLIMAEIHCLVPAAMLFQAYVAEATPVGSRAKVFGRLGAATSLEGVVAPLATLLVSRHGSALVVGMSMLISLSTAHFFLPDPSAKRLSNRQLGDNRRRQSVRERFVGILTLVRHPIYLKLALLMVVGGCTTAGLSAIWRFFLQARFGMEYKDAVPFISISTLSTCLVNVFLINPMIRLMGMKTLAIFSLGKGVLTCVAYILAPSSNWLYVICICVGLDQAFGPVVLALFTNLADRGDIGVTVGTITSLTTISQIFGPLLYRVVFTYFLSPSTWFPEGFSSAPWVLAIVTNIVCIMLVICIPSSAFPNVSRNDFGNDVETSDRNEARINS